MKSNNLNDYIKLLEADNDINKMMNVYSSITGGNYIEEVTDGILELELKDNVFTKEGVCFGLNQFLAEICDDEEQWIHYEVEDIEEIHFIQFHKENLRSKMIGVAEDFEDYLYQLYTIDESRIYEN